MSKDLEWIEKSGGFEWTPGSPWPPEVPDAIGYSDYYYDYTRNDPDRKNPFTDPEDRERAFKVTTETPWIYESPDGGKTVTRRKPHSFIQEVESVDMYVVSSIISK